MFRYLESEKSKTDIPLQNCKGNCDSIRKKRELLDSAWKMVSDSYHQNIDIDVTKVGNGLNIYSRIRLHMIKHLAFMYGLLRENKTITPLLFITPFALLSFIWFLLCSISSKRLLERSMAKATVICIVASLVVMYITGRFIRLSGDDADFFLILKLLAVPIILGEIVGYFQYKRPVNKPQEDLPKAPHPSQLPKMWEIVKSTFWIWVVINVGYFVLIRVLLLTKLRFYLPYFIPSIGFELCEFVFMTIAIIIALIRRAIGEREKLRKVQDANNIFINGGIIK